MQNCRYFHPCSFIPTTAEKGEFFPFGATSGQQNILNGLPNSRFSQEIDELGSGLIYICINTERCSAITGVCQEQE